MNEHQTTEKINALAAAILKDWADRGKVIEGGWAAYVALSDLKNAPDNQVKAMRKAYMLGAQHLFSSIVGMLDEDKEPTERDLRRMDLIHKELEAFRLSLTH